MDFKKHPINPTKILFKTKQELRTQPNTIINKQDFFFIKYKLRAKRGLFLVIV